jgi:hypothetical protein
VSFDVWWTPAGDVSAKGLDKPIADAVDMQLCRALDLQMPPGERTKPPCCDSENDAPPVDDELVHRFQDGVKRLRRENRPVQRSAR